MPARTPAEVHACFVDAFNSGDVETLVSLYEPDAVLIFDGEPYTGHEAIRQVYGQALESKGQMTMITRQVIESGSGMALLHGSWLMEAAAAGAGVARRGLSSEVVRRQPDGTWLFVLDNPVTPER